MFMRSFVTKKMFEQCISVCSCGSLRETRGLHIMWVGCNGILHFWSDGSQRALHPSLFIALAGAELHSWYVRDGDRPPAPHQHTCVCAVFRWRKGGMVIGWGYCADESESAGLPCIFYALHHSVCLCKICVSIWTIGLQKRGGWKGNRVKSSWICPDTNCTLWSAGLLGILVSSCFKRDLLCFLYFLSHLYCWTGRCSCKRTFGCSVWICMTSVRADIPNLVFIFEGQLNLKGEELKQLN